MMKKIGILTFHRAENFGAVFQCFALMSYLQKKTYDVKIVDYRQYNIEKGYKIFSITGDTLISKVKSLIIILLTLKSRWKKKRSFAKFRNQYLHLTSPIYDENDFNDEYDYLICGSDQIWNLRLTAGVDDFYFLNIKTKAKKIAFAASSEQKDWPLMLSYLPNIKNALSTFQSISVREEGFAKYIDKHFSIPCHIVSDPIFLFDKNFYKRFISNKPKKKKYVLVYNLVESSKSREVAKYLANKYKLKVITISASIQMKSFFRRDISVFGPIDLLEYIYNAEYIVTTSFHGLAFSLIFNRQVYAISTNFNVRLTSLLTKVGLEDRMVTNEFCESIIDYSIVNQKLHDIRFENENFLNNNL